MNICNNLSLINSGYDLISNTLLNTPLKQKVAILALTILGCLTLAYVSFRCTFKAKKLEQDDEGAISVVLHSQIIEAKEPLELMEEGTKQQAEQVQQQPFGKVQTPVSSPLTKERRPLTPPIILPASPTLTVLPTPLVKVQGKPDDPLKLKLPKQPAATPSVPFTPIVILKGQPDDPLKFKHPRQSVLTPNRPLALPPLSAELKTPLKQPLDVGRVVITRQSKERINSYKRILNNEPDVEKPDYKKLFMGLRMQNSTDKQLYCKPTENVLDFIRYATDSKEINVNDPITHQVFADVLANASPEARLSVVKFLGQEVKKGPLPNELIDKCLIELKKIAMATESQATQTELEEFLRTCLFVPGPSRPSGSGPTEVSVEALDSYRKEQLSEGQIGKMLERFTTSCGTYAGAKPPGWLTQMFGNPYAPVNIDGMQPVPLDQMLLYVACDGQLSGAHRRVARKDIDLSNPTCCKLLNDVMKHVNGSLRYEIAKMVTGNVDYVGNKAINVNAETVKACLDGILDRKQATESDETRMSIKELLKFSLYNSTPFISPTDISMVRAASALLANPKGDLQQEQIHMISLITNAFLENPNELTLDKFLLFAGAFTGREQTAMWYLQNYQIISDAFNANTRLIEEYEANKEIDSSLKEFIDIHFLRKI
jgi:hypothetical protein